MKAILFDLDGTLIDSSEGITKSAQYALSHFGIDEPDRNSLFFFIRPCVEASINVSSAVSRCILRLSVSLLILF